MTDAHRLALDCELVAAAVAMEAASEGPGEREARDRACSIARTILNSEAESLHGLIVKARALDWADAGSDQATFAVPDTGRATEIAREALRVAAGYSPDE